MDEQELKRRTKAFGLKVIKLLEILHEAGVVPIERVASLKQEADELIAILTATVRTARNSLSGKG